MVFEDVFGGTIDSCTLFFLDAEISEMFSSATGPPHSIWPKMVVMKCFSMPSGLKEGEYSNSCRMGCLYPTFLRWEIPSKKIKLLYFEWSPPWHVGWRLSGEGCHWEYDGKNGEFENIDFRFPWLSDTSEMGFGHDVPFLNYSDTLPHPSDLCQPDRVRWG